MSAIQVWVKDDGLRELGDVGEGGLLASGIW